MAEPEAKPEPEPGAQPASGINDMLSTSGKLITKKWAHHCYCVTQLLPLSCASKNSGASSLGGHQTLHNSQWPENLKREGCGGGVVRKELGILAAPSTLPPAPLARASLTTTSNKLPRAPHTHTHTHTSH